MCRLRHIYASLPASLQDSIVRDSFGHRVELPEDAKHHVLSSFDQWRTWDHDGLESSLIMNVIFGKSPVSSESSNAGGAVEVDLHIGSTAIILDPGPNQSALILGNMNAGISSTTIFSNNDAHLPKKQNAQMKIEVQSYVSQIALNVDWEVVELVGDTLEQFKLFELNAASRDKNLNQGISSTAQKLDVSVVLGTDSASITVDTINLNLRLAATKLQASLMHLDLQDNRQNSSIVVASTTASARLRSKKRALL